MLATLSSQSFRSQVASLGSALQSGQLSLAQFGLEGEVRAEDHWRPSTVFLPAVCFAKARQDVPCAFRH